MKVFDLTLPGFDGSGDTDDCVKWVKAPDIGAVIAFCEAHGIKYQSLDELEDREDIDFDDGLDVRLNVDGKVVAAAVGVDLRMWVKIPYSPLLAAERRLKTAKHIAAMILDHPSVDMPEELAAELGRDILYVVLREFRGDLFQFEVKQ